MEAVAWDLRWKVARGLPVGHVGWHPPSLTKVRARLLLHGKERLALDNTLRLAEKVGLLDGRAEQIVDSTPMLGAAATQDTVRLIRHRVLNLLDSVAALDEQAGKRLDDGFESDYRQPAEKPDCRWRERAERERMLTRIADDAERALLAVERADRLLGAETVADAHKFAARAARNRDRLTQPPDRHIRSATPFIRVLLAARRPKRRAADRHFFRGLPSRPPGPAGR